MGDKWKIGRNIVVLCIIAFIGLLMLSRNEWMYGYRFVLLCIISFIMVFFGWK